MKEKTFEMDDDDDSSSNNKIICNDIEFRWDSENTSSIQQTKGATQKKRTNSTNNSAIKISNDGKNPARKRERESEMQPSEREKYLSKQTIADSYMCGAYSSAVHTGIASSIRLGYFRWNHG